MQNISLYYCQVVTVHLCICCEFLHYLCASSVIAVLLKEETVTHLMINRCHKSEMTS